MVTIDGVEYMDLRSVAEHFNVSYNAISQYIYRHKEIPRRHIGHNTVLVRLEDFGDYQRRARRK